jgi:hypothetical protein
MSKKLQERMKWSNLSDDYVYPVRAIANRSFVDTNLLDSRALSQKEKIEQNQFIKKAGRIFYPLFLCC